MALILSIETATEACSVAISKDDKLLNEKTLDGGMRHSAALTTLIKDVINDSGHKLNSLTCIALSDGPGSYTGLRVGASTAKGICYALGIPLIAIPTLQALSKAPAENDCHIMATIDARRMEAYTAVYHKDHLTEEVHSVIFTEEQAEIISKSYQSLIITGTGIKKASHLFNKYEHIQIQPQKCSASLIAALAYSKYEQNLFVDVAYHSPFYFKSPNITTSKKTLLE